MPANWRRMHIEEVVESLLLSLYLANTGARGAVFSPTQTVRADGVKHKAAYWQRATNVHEWLRAGLGHAKLLELWIHDTQKRHNI